MLNEIIKILEAPLSNESVQDLIIEIAHCIEQRYSQRRKT